MTMCAHSGSVQEGRFMKSLHFPIQLKKSKAILIEATHATTFNLDNVTMIFHDTKTSAAYV